MSNKKVKKNKGTTISLQAFNAQLDDGTPSSGQNVVYTSKKPTYTNWADEMDEEELITEKQKIYLPSGPRSSREPNIDDSQIPRTPPFTVHLSNVAYEIGDEDIYNFFQDMKICQVRIPRDPGNRPKGYAYIDFDNREDLIAALAMTDQQLKGRSVRISLGESQNRRDGGPGRGPGGGGGYSDATPSDWRSDMKPNSPPRGGGGGFNDFRRGNDFNRGGDFERGGGRDRGGYGGDMTRDQMSSAGYGGRRGYNDFSERGDRDNFQRDRSGSNEMDASWRSERPPAAIHEPQQYGRNNYGGGPGSRQPMDYGGMRMRDEPRGGHEGRGYQDRGGYQRNQSPHRGGGGGYDDDRSSRRGYAGSRTSRESSPPASYRNTSELPSEQSAAEQSRERKKLVLAPRTVKSQIAEPAPETSSAIFGGAKPVDTAAREKEIEQKLMSLDIRATTTSRVRSDSQVDEPRIRILQRTPEERDRRDRERVLKQRDRYPSMSSDKGHGSGNPSREFHHSHSLPPDLPPKGRQQHPPRSPITPTPSTATVVPSASASSFCSETFHPNNNPPTSKNFQRSEDEGEGELTESSARRVDGPQRSGMVQNEIEPAAKNPWTRRTRDEGHSHNGEDFDRKTPDFDRNGEKEKDTNSDPEDDRDHRFIHEDNNKPEEDDDDDFHKVSRSRGRREREVIVDKGYDGSRGDRRGGAGGRGGGSNYSGGGGYSGNRGSMDSSRRGERMDGPRRQPYGRAGGDAGGGRGGGRGGYGSGDGRGPPPRER